MNRDILSSARPPELDPLPDETRRMRDLRAAFDSTGSRTGSGRSGPRRTRVLLRRPVLGTAVGLVAAAAIAIPLAAGPAVVAPAAPAAAPVQTLSAQQVLLAAATSAAAKPAASGTFWHSSQLQSTVDGTTDGYLVESRSRSEMWTAKSPTTDSWWISTGLGAKPLGPADEEAWRRAGSPGSFQLAGAPNCPPDATVKCKSIEITSTPRTPFGNTINDGDKVADLGGRNVSMAELQALPADPVALRDLLLKGYAGHGTESTSDPMDRETWLFTVASGLITSMPVTPEVRSAAFKMLADLPGINVVPDVRDALGRPGAAVSMREPLKDGGVLEHRVLVDMAAGDALGTEIYVVEPGRYQQGLAPGQRWISTVVESAGWTDEHPPAVRAPGE